MNPLLFLRLRLYAKPELLLLVRPSPDSLNAQEKRLDTSLKLETRPHLLHVMAVMLHVRKVNVVITVTVSV